ncbi:MAG: hypothetical protein ACYCY2_03395 [Acidithiobacillus ferriphilus]
MQTNVEKFKSELIRQYYNLINDPDYTTAFYKMTPEQLADKMTAAFIVKGASKDSKGVQRTCKALGIKYTYKAINAFLKEGA